MKFDFYTKAILTIIAGCLFWICIRDFVFTNPVHAQPAQPAQPVVIVGYALRDGIPVSISTTNGSLPVIINGIERGTSYTSFSPPSLLPWQPLPVTSVNSTPTSKPK